MSYHCIASLLLAKGFSLQLNYALQGGFFSSFFELLHSKTVFGQEWNRIAKTQYIRQMPNIITVRTDSDY